MDRTRIWLKDTYDKLLADPMYINDFHSEDVDCLQINYDNIVETTAVSIVKMKLASFCSNGKFTDSLIH